MRFPMRHLLRPLPRRPLRGRGRRPGATLSPVLLFVLPLVLLLVVPVLSGCAALFRGPLQQVPVRSTPPGAEVFVDGERLGRTPLEVQLTRAGVHSVTVRLGDQERFVMLDTGIDGEGGLWLLADAVPGGVLLTAAAVGLGGCSAEDGLACAAIGVPLLAAGAGLVLLPVGVDLLSGAAAQLSPGEVLVTFDASLPALGVPPGEPTGSDR